MAGGYQYDQDGQSYFFFLTVLLLVLLPFTYSATRGGGSDVTKARRVPYPCVGWNKKTDDVAKSVGGLLGLPRLSTKWLLLSLGWITFAVVVRNAAMIAPNELIYDPYKILGISRGATEQQIKSHFRKLSRKFHPDKVVLSDNQTAEEVNEHFIQLSKAHQALTNEEVRHNFETYGHPDGKQDFSQGIALPAWIVESKNTGWIIGAYALVLGVMLPYFVGRWWYGSRSRTKDSILNSTADTFFRQLKEDVNFGQLVDILASAEEFAVTPSLVKTRKSLAKLAVDEYARVVSIVKAGPDGKQGWESYSSWSPAKKRARVLIASHMLRVPITNPALLRERHETVTIAMKLTTGLSSIALAHNWLSVLIAILHLQQFLLQAVHPSSSPLLQLPHVDSNIADRALKVRKVETIPQFAQLDETEATKIIASASATKPNVEKVRETLQVAKHWPTAEIVSAKFEIVGEKVITPGSIINFTIKLRMTPPGRASSSSAKVVSSSDSTKPETTTPQVVEAAVDVQGAEKTIDELIGRRSKEADGVVPTPLAHAPHSPEDHKPVWYVFVGDHKLNRVFVQPHKFTDWWWGNESGTKEGEGEGVVRTVRLSFQAPPGPGLYTFQAYVMSDSFVGTDLQKDMRMKVDPPVEGSEPIEEDYISEPDEDSLAGQMALMKGQPVRRAPISRGGGDSDSDDTSATDDDEEEEEDSDSDSD